MGGGRGYHILFMHVWPVHHILDAAIPPSKPGLLMLGSDFWKGASELWPLAAKIMLSTGMLAGLELGRTWTEHPAA